MFKCELNDSFYEIEFPSDLSAINSNEVLFEDNLLLINKASLAACKKFLNKKSVNELISLKIPQSFFTTDISFLKNKSKIRDYIIGRFSQNQLLATLNLKIIKKTVSIG